MGIKKKLSLFFYILSLYANSTHSIHTHCFSIEHSYTQLPPAFRLHIQAPRTRLSPHSIHTEQSRIASSSRLHKPNIFDQRPPSNNQTLVALPHATTPNNNQKRNCTNNCLCSPARCSAIRHPGSSEYPPVVHLLPITPLRQQHPRRRRESKR